jgi:hypothetical protein
MPDFGESQTEIEFLQSKSDSSNLIIVAGSGTTTGAFVTYTPASGKTFVLVGAKVVLNCTSTNPVDVQLRNNGAVRELAFGLAATSAGISSFGYEYVTRGDTLVGDGAKTYDLNVSVNTDSHRFAGTIEGYLE